MAEFVTGEIELTKFKQLVEEHLFELRQNAEVTDEKRFLSAIELYLHESEEGLRDKGEIYAQVQNILDKIIVPSLTTKAVTIKSEFIVPGMRYFPSNTFDVDQDSPGNQRTETKNLSLINSW